MSPPQTNRQASVDAAMAILAEQGIDAFSLRNIARKVGVKAPSLYWHVKDKRELLGHMTERVFRETVLAAMPAADTWQEWLQNLGTTIYRSQQGVRDVQRSVIQGRMDRAVLGEFSATLCAELVARDFPAEHVFDAQRSAMTLATGWTMIRGRSELSGRNSRTQFRAHPRHAGCRMGARDRARGRETR